MASAGRLRCTRDLKLVEALGGGPLSQGGTAMILEPRQLLVTLALGLLSIASTELGSDKRKDGNAQGCTTIGCSVMTTLTCPCESCSSWTGHISVVLNCDGSCTPPPVAGRVRVTYSVTCGSNSCPATPTEVSRDCSSSTDVCHRCNCDAGTITFCAWVIDGTGTQVNWGSLLPPPAPACSQFAHSCSAN